MSLTPLAFGTTANPLDVLTPQDKQKLLECGPFDLGKLNALLKALADQIDAVDAADNTIADASYNATTNVLTVTMLDGPSVNIDFTAVINDAVTTGLIAGSSYNPATNILTLTLNNGTTIPLDMTALMNDAISNAIMPTGGIIMWSGGAVPGGWNLCDGTNGTPDLRDRFIIAAGPTYAAGSTGGADTHNHGGTTADHVLTVAELPAHQHGAGISDDNVGGLFLHGSVPAAGGSGIQNTGGSNLEPLTSFVGGDQPHAHGITAASHLPPYYALAFIMKL